MRRTMVWRVVRWRFVTARRPVRRYAAKFAGASHAMPTRPPWRHILYAWLGAILTLGTIGWLAEITHAPLVMAPFGASAVLLFAHPDSLLTQPRNVLLGHFLGGSIGLIAGTALGEGWLAMALAVATTIAATKATRSVHPPAGATAIVCMHAHAAWSFLLAPVLAGSALLVLAAAVYNNTIEHRRYPLRWW